MIFQPRADDLPLVVQIFRPDESHDTVDEKRLKRPSHSVGSRFESQLVHSMMRLDRKSAALAGFEVHSMIACPTDISLAVMFKNSFAAFTQHAESNSETAVRRFRASDGLEKKIDWSAALHRRQLRRDMP